jgi:UPF0271 protein
MRIDLNADVGEGCDDLSLMPHLTSANVACGGHAGDESTMTHTVVAAARLGLAIGAHPSYPDREHFGRRELAIADDELAASLAEQFTRLARIVSSVGARLVHVKPHGALYNRAARDGALARLVARTFAALDPSLRLVGLAGSQSIVAGRGAGLAVAEEAFADRRYAADGALVSRSLDGAVVRDPRAAADQAASIVLDESVTASSGERVRVRADTLCIHGDTEGAAAIARAVRERLERAGVTIAPLAQRLPLT